MRLAVKIALVLLVLGGAMYLFVFPARTYLAQKQGIAAEERTVAVLKAEDSKLTAESSALQDNATIEQIARRDTAWLSLASRPSWCCRRPAILNRRPRRRPSTRPGTLRWSSGTTCEPVRQ